MVVVPPDYELPVAQGVVIRWIVVLKQPWFVLLQNFSLSEYDARSSYRHADWSSISVVATPWVLFPSHQRTWPRCFDFWISLSGTCFPCTTNKKDMSHNHDTMKPSLVHFEDSKHTNMQCSIWSSFRNLGTISVLTFCMHKSSLIFFQTRSFFMYR